MRRLSLLMVLGVAASSCGGGGGNVQPVSTFRPNGPGDAWNYDVETINFGVFGNYSGTLSEVMTADTYNNAPSIRFTSTFNLTLQTGPAVITSYEELSPQGGLLAEIDNGALSAVTSDTFSVPTPLSLTTNTSGMIKLADGTSFAITYKVTGTAQVITSAGVFNCWVVTENVTHSDTTTDAFTIWIAPETGNYVRLTDTTVNPDGSGYQYTALLTSIDVPATSRPGLVPLPPTNHRLPLPL